MGTRTIDAKTLITLLVEGDGLNTWERKPALPVLP